MEKALNVDIRQFYREDLGVHSEELLDKLEAVSQAVTLQKGEILNKKGERQTMLPFLIEGMMRCVTLDSEGKEMICPLSSRQVKYLKVSDKNTYISFWSVGIFMHTISLYIF